MTCGDFPGPGVEHHLLANPLQDLIHTSPVGHAHRMFGHFKEKFERQYENEKEHEEREHNFVHNIRWGKTKTNITRDLLVCNEIKKKNTSIILLQIYFY